MDKLNELFFLLMNLSPGVSDIIFEIRHHSRTFNLIARVNGERHYYDLSSRYDKWNEVLNQVCISQEKSPEEIGCFALEFFNVKMRYQLQPIYPEGMNWHIRFLPPEHVNKELLLTENMLLIQSFAARVKQENITHENQHQWILGVEELLRHEKMNKELKYNETQIKKIKL